jgi:DNA-binding transcriptional ArsR family regulator
MTPGNSVISVTDDTLVSEMTVARSPIALPVVPELRFDLPRPDVTDAARIAGLLGDPVRAGILAILRDGPHCVFEMAAALDERQNNVSNHLARMREAGLVRASRLGVDSRRSYYERDEAGISRAREALTAILG